MELQRAAVYLGIAHSTGYPLYILLAHVFSRIGTLLGDNPFTWVTYFSSVTVALSVMILYQMLRLWFAWPAALLAACVYGFSGMVWHMATVPEVQGLHLLLLAGILYLFALYLKGPRNITYIEGIALLFGLGLANHRTIVLFAIPIVPLIVLDLIRQRLNFWIFVRIAVIGLAPLLFYFYIVYEAAGVNLYGQVTVYQLGTVYDHLNTPYSLLQLMLGLGLSAQVMLPNTLPGMLTRLTGILSYLAGDMTSIGMFLGLIGLLLLFLKKKLVGALFLALAAIELLFLVAWQSQKGFVYTTPLILILSIGIAALANTEIKLKSLSINPLSRLHFLEEKASKLPTRTIILPLAVILWLLPAILLVIQFPQNNRSTDNTGQVIYSAYLCTPTNSLIFTGGYGPSHFIGLEAKRVRDDLNFNPSNDDYRQVVNAATSSQPVYLTATEQHFLGMMDGQLGLPQNGIALSATTYGFIQVRPHNDPTLAQEAQQATVVDKSVVPGIRLYSYRAVKAANGLEFVLYWKADEDITTTFKPFAHLRQIDAAGNVLALLSQRDYPNPVDNYYPTQFWKKDEFIRDIYLIPWPAASLPPANTLRWAFGFTNEAGQRQGEVNIPFQDVTPTDSQGCSNSTL